MLLAKVHIGIVAEEDQQHGQRSAKQSPQASAISLHRCFSLIGTYDWQELVYYKVSRRAWGE